MNPIYNNPFRILDIPITASEREIAKQINTLSTYAEMGKGKSFDTDFPFLPAVERTHDNIEEAKKQLEQSESKLLYSLFWFWKNNIVDELALDILKEGNTDKTISILEKSAIAGKNKIFKEVVLIENLIHSSRSWSKEKSENHFLTKSEDEYIVDSMKEANSSIPSVYAELNYNDNWTIECDTQWISGIDNNTYGITFGRNRENYFFFGIAGSGSFMYCKYVDSSFTPLIEWKETPKFYNRSSNNLKIEKIGTNLNFFVNGINVDNFEAEPFFGKFFGFKVTNNQKISFRNFKFCKLEEDETYGEGLNVTPKNFSNIKNLSTLYLSLSLAASKGTFNINHFKKGVALAKNIFANGNMDEYSKLIAGDRYIYNTEKILHFYVNDILESIKPFIGKIDGISISEIIRSFSAFPIEARQYLNSRFVAKQMQEIDKEIERAESTRRNSEDSASDAGKTLVKNTKTDIAYLKNILGESDFQYQILVDKLSHAIVQCGIDAFNVCKDSKGEIDYVKAIKSEEAYLSEYEYARNIAVSQRAKEHAQENIFTCKRFIEDKYYYNCWFCGINPPEDFDKFEITIYKVSSRSYIPRRVQFSYLPVSIPRCSNCQKIHSQSKDKFIFVLVICALVGLIIGAMIDGYWLPGLLAGGVIGGILGEILKSFQISKKAIKDTSQSTIKNYPIINQALNEGWQFSKPSA